MSRLYLIILALIYLLDLTCAQSRLFTSQKSLRCTNYGDPHIFPFSGDMQTCGLCGTHVLVKNDWIIVTATFDYVNMSFSSATFTSKINIAFFNQDGLLISTFGSEDIERNCKSYNGFIGSGDHIRAYISGETGTAYLYYKQTKINVFIRQNRYGYSFGIYLPEMMITHTNGICVAGCPSDQVLRLEKIDNPIIQSRIPAATELCSQRFLAINPNDPYLEPRIRACIFDVAITGDETLAQDHIQEVTDETLSFDESQHSRLRLNKQNKLLKSRTIIPPTKQVNLVDTTQSDKCVPLDCKQIQNGVHERFEYPGRPHYYFECIGDGVIQTRRCPINHIFSNNMCVPQNF